MQIINHRCNDIETLSKTKNFYGVEIDLRSSRNQIILSHDPFKTGINFEKWLNHFNHNFLILNVKEDGLEDKILRIMDKYNLNNFFFLDQTFPSIIKLTNLNFRKIAIRLSEYEPIDCVINFAGKAEWVWVDYFNKFPLDKKTYTLLHDIGFKICLVSPELHSLTQSKSIDKLIEFLKHENIYPDAVCTKLPDAWFSKF